MHIRKTSIILGATLALCVVSVADQKEPLIYQQLKDGFLPVTVPEVVTPVIVDDTATFEIPTSKPEIKVLDPKIGTEVLSGIRAWAYDPNVSWYGPGFYGNRTACGLKLTKTLIGVAHRTLPCGTLVTFRYKGIIVTAPVVDRGPYVSGRQFDLTRGLCKRLNHCFTASLYYYIHKK